MTKSADGDWYFSREGQQSGPLSYADLKAKAEEGALKPRTDLVWKEGMPDWVPVGEVDGLFERREVAPPPPAPGAADIEAAMMDSYSDTRMGPFGGCRRRSYLFVLFILPALVMFLTTMAPTMFPAVFTPDIAALVTKFGPIALLVISFYVGLQRFANLGMSRWWYLGHFVPLLNLWTAYRCFACPEGYAVHKQMDAAGILLAILYWLFLLVIVAAVAVVIAVLAGAAGSPEFQKVIQEHMQDVVTQFQGMAKPPVK